MKLFANCPHCKASVKDKKLLQLLDVWAIKCPNCGGKISPFSAAKSDIIIEVGVEEAEPESSAYHGQPINFNPNIKLDHITRDGGRADDNNEVRQSTKSKTD